MKTFIPAAPGWYVHEQKGVSTTHIPVIAGSVESGPDGDVLLPAVNAGPGLPPRFLTRESMQARFQQVLYMTLPDVSTGYIDPR